jgi:hypothetical protein
MRVSTAASRSISPLRKCVRITDTLSERTQSRRSRSGVDLDSHLQPAVAVLEPLHGMLGYRRSGSSSCRVPCHLLQRLLHDAGLEMQRM